ncbi:MAG: carbohydrate kinase family protein [Halanaerobiaceae bacterium]
MLTKECNKDVAVVGDVNVDIIVHFPEYLNEERTRVNFKEPILLGGGTAANSAVSLSRLGINTAFVGTVGDDQYGYYVANDLQEEGIDTVNLIVDPGVNTVSVFAFVDEYGERYLWAWPRENQSFKKLELEKVDMSLLRDVDWIHSSGMIVVADTSARHSIIEIFKKAYAQGITTSFDLNLRVNDNSIDQKYKNAILEIVDSCNYVLGSGEEEFNFLNSEQDWIASAQSIVSEDRTVITRMGARGSMAFTSEKRITRRAFDVEVCDTVGAGDVYNGGFIAARLQGLSLGRSLEAGNAAAGYVVSRDGARQSPTAKELDKFLQTHSKVE